MIDPVDAMAQHLYRTAENQVKPTWEQIDDVTRSVWREMAEVVMFGGMA